MIRWLYFWTPFPVNAVINLKRGYPVRTSWSLHQIAWKVERGAP